MKIWDRLNIRKTDLLFFIWKSLILIESHFANWTLWLSGIFFLNKKIMLYSWNKLNPIQLNIKQLHRMERKKKREIFGKLMGWILKIYHLKKIVSHVHQIEMLLRRIDTFIRPIRDQWNIIIPDRVIAILVYFSFWFLFSFFANFNDNNFWFDFCVFFLLKFLISLHKQIIFTIKLK